MSVEVSVICDLCGATAAADKTAARARFVVKDLGGVISLPGGLDVCARCRERPTWREELARWRVTLAQS